ERRLQNQDALLQRSSPVTYTDFLNSTIDTQKQYLELGAPVLPVLKERRGEYVVVPVVHEDPKMERSLTLLEVLSDQRLKKRYPEALAALPDLARRMARVSHVGDFGLRQFLFDFKSKKWILTDWLGYPTRTKGFDSFASSGHPLIVAIGELDR